QGGFRLLALGDVAKDRCEIEVLASRPVGDGYFHGKFLSVFFSGDQLERLADDSWLTGSDESPEAALVRFMEPSRHEQSQRLTKDFVCAVPEYALGRLIEINHLPAGVRGNDGVARRLRYGAIASLGVDQLGGERPDSCAKEQRPRTDEGNQQDCGELQLLADRTEDLGGIDLHHHAQAQVAHRTVCS